LLDECRITAPGQPEPVSAGLFGYLGYDMVRYAERLPDDKPEAIDTPEAILIRPTLLAIFDQIENKFTLVTPIWFDPKADPKAAFDAAQQRLQRGLGDLQQPLPLIPATAPSRQSAEVAANMTEAAYVDMVARAKEYIRAGDIFQVVLSQRFSRPFDLPPFALYRAIRRLDPSPFLFFFDFGAFSVVGSSPEILVRVRDGKITIRPIAGTRRRNVGNQTDAELEAELLADPKELAEHLMLLDLGRNDVGRFSKMGTVKVTARNTIEYYKHVMHIVSNVEGELDPRYSSIDALMGGFPAGTLSGAPKIRAMEIIAELEPDRRGVYGGCIGYFGSSGTMDTAIAIRTAVIKDGQMHIQAGAGIVYDSDPQGEYRECNAKAQGLLRAAEAAVAFARKE
jgi:anthranilate synthase component 1